MQLKNRSLYITALRVYTILKWTTLTAFSNSVSYQPLKDYVVIMVAGVQASPALASKACAPARHRFNKHRRYFSN
jgi:hypothetical protein